jgi:glycosyltransferase involved in cell wall biosynthesis
MEGIHLRVLHVVDTRQLRGAEMFASDLIRALSRAGVSQRVGVVHDSGETGIRYDAPEDVLGADGWMAPGLRIRPQALRELRMLIGNWRPHIVQAHGGSTLKYTIPAVTAQRARVVYRQIGPTPKEIAGPVRRAVHGFLMRRTGRVVAVGETVRRNILEMFRVPAEQVITIPNAVDPRRIRTTLDREATRRALEIAPDSPVLISLGALTWEKNPLVHLEIGARVLGAFPDAIHLMVGDGPMRSQVATAIRTRGLQRRILMTGARVDAADLLAASDLLLFASRPDGMESMNASVIEAGMLGIPAVAYAVGGVPEVVVDGLTGRLVHAGDVDRAAAGVLELLANPVSRRAMGAAAKKHYLSQFDMAAIAPKYLELYKELVVS